MKFLTFPFVLFDKFVKVDLSRYGRIFETLFAAICITALSILTVIWTPLLIIAFFLENDF
jgi:predicted permease